MISEFLLNIVFGIVSGMFELLPEFSWTVENSAFQHLFSFIRAVGYLLPWGTVGSIVAIILLLTSIRFVIALIKAIWELLPIV